MCIRDRAAAVQLAFLELAEKLFGESGHQRTANAGCRRRFSCLLYTSDAADERSSVDLGGRRIIKKKKTMEDQEGTP